MSLFLIIELVHWYGLKLFIEILTGIRVTAYYNTYNNIYYVHNPLYAFIILLCFHNKRFQNGNIFHGIQVYALLPIKNDYTSLK